MIPAWASSARLLLTAGEDDHNHDSAEHARRLGAAMERRGKPGGQWAVVTYPGGGHLLNTAYCPPTFTSKHPLAGEGRLLYMGGADDRRQHHRMEIAAWEDQLGFLRDALRP